MLLESIEAFNFRNLEGILAFDPGLTIFAGENGQGKTNWLEAISVLASTRSFRTPKFQEAIAFGETSFAIRGSEARGSASFGVAETSCGALWP